MTHIFKLLLPTLFPSWRFFDVIAPSPRIQYALLNAAGEITDVWQEFRPHPAHLPFKQILQRMVWNPDWNESLFLTSCAERLLEKSTAHSEDEILNRIMADLRKTATHTRLNTATQLQFRLQLIQRNGQTIEQEIVFYSRIQPIHKDKKRWS